MKILDSTRDKLSGLAIMEKKTVDVRLTRQAAEKILPHLKKMGIEMETGKNSERKTFLIPAATIDRQERLQKNINDLCSILTPVRTEQKANPVIKKATANAQTKECSVKETTPRMRDEITR